MSDQDMLHTQSSPEGQVSDMPPEPKAQEGEAAVNAAPEEPVVFAREILPEESEEMVPGAQPGKMQSVGEEGTYNQTGSGVQGEAAADGAQQENGPAQAEPEKYAQAASGSVQEHSEGNGQADYGYGQSPPEGNAGSVQTDYNYSYGQSRSEENAQTGYSQNPPYSQPQQGNGWQNHGFDRTGGQAPPPPGYGNGTQQNYGYGPGPNQGQYDRGNRSSGKSSNHMAMASMILGILSVLLCCCGGFGIILGAIGIVLAVLSRGREPMETSAKVGIGLSIGGIALSIIVLVMALVIGGNSELRSDLYRRGYGDYGDYEDFEHYFEHNGL